MLNITNEIKAQAETERRIAWAMARAAGHVGPEELAAFFTAVNANVTTAYLLDYPGTPGNHYTLALKVGMKFAKLVLLAPGQTGGSAYAFIDLTNGDILKPASWKAPAKHARGNIRIGDASNWWQRAMDQYSVAYLD